MRSSDSIDPAKGRIAGAWHACMQGGRSLSRATTRAFALLLKALVLAYFAFCILFLGLRYIVLPNIDQYKGTVEKLSTRVVGRPVSIGTIHASWHGLNPQLILNHVEIRNRTGATALSLPRVSATISWWSVAVAGLRLQSLEILRPDVEIERDADGSLFVGGIHIDPDAQDNDSGIDWLLQQNQIVVRDGWVRWKDAKRKAPELVLSQVSAVIENDWLRHRIAIRATPPADVGAPLDFRARFSHSPFATSISDISSWTGTLFVDWNQADLARGNTWIDYPVEIRQGRGSVRAWLSFDHATVTELVADLGLSDLSTRLRSDLDELHLTRVQGRVAAGETGNGRADRLFWYGRRGHTFAVRDFSFETSDGLQLPPTTISEKYTEADGARPARTEVQLESVDLQALASLATRLPLSAEQRKTIAGLAPAGRLANLNAKWEGSWPEIKSYQLKGDFAGLTLRGQPPLPARAQSAAGPARPESAAVPGFVNLTGSVDLDEKGGNIRIHAPNSVLHLPGLFATPEFGFEELDLSARWTVQDGKQVQVQVGNASFVHDGMRGSASGRYQIRLGDPNAGAGMLELNAQLDQLDARKAGRYLPMVTPPDLAHWLTDGLQGGKLQDVSLVVKGDLDEFPFRTTRPNQKPRGEFLVKGRIVDGRIDYAPGEMAARDPSRQQWPSIEAIQGRLTIDRARLEIRADKARSHDVALSAVQATIADLLADNPRLDVTGTALGPLQELLGFVVDSPVGEWIGDFTDEARASGNARLQLDLRLPIEHIDNARVKGTLQFLNNDITLFADMPPLLRTTGELRFTDTGFDLSNVRANFIGGAVTVSGSSPAPGRAAIRAEGTVSVDGLRRSFTTPAVAQLLQQMSGASRYSVQVNVRDEQPEIIVESNLQGIALDFPAPLKKPAADALVSRFQLSPRGFDAGGAARDEIRASLGKTVNVHYLRRRAARQGGWEVIAGGIGVNQPAPISDNGLVVNVDLAALDVDAWRAATSSVSGASADAQAAGKSGGGLNLAQYFDPDVMAARATELTITGKTLNNVVVGASNQDGLWQANIDADQVSGYLSWAESRSGRGRGRVTARLSSLIIPPSAASDVTELLEGKGSATRIPALDVVAENFELFNRKFGRLELNANNQSTPTGREWRINKLSVVNPDASMSATGSYQGGAGESLSSLDFQLNIADAGRLLNRLGFERVLRGGRGLMTGEVSWNGLPFSLDVPSLSGELKLDLAAGQFLKVEPGAAKLLGVLSLQSLPRRLALDFRDIFSEGFAFDGVTGTAGIKHGIMTTDSLKMRGVSAAVLMDGIVDLASERQDLHVVVIPEINAGAASVAYGLMVNPVLGIGSFLAQLFLRDPLMRAFTMEYQISGPWSDPSIRKLARAANQNTDGAGNTGPGGAPPAGSATPAESNPRS